MDYMGTACVVHKVLRESLCFRLQQLGQSTFHQELKNTSIKNMTRIFQRPISALK